MKLSGFLLMLTVLQVLAVDSYSQRAKLTLDLKNVTVEDALKTIEDQSEFFFLYSPKMVDVSRKVDIELADKEVDFILDQMFAETGVDYVIKDRQIVITTNEMIQPFKKEIQQQIVVTGTVTDEDGNPLPGVNIIIKGTLTGAITNADGNYSIEVDDPNATLVFSFIGMLTQEIKVGDQTEINKTMARDVIGLEEVVAIGYGTIRKRDLTGTISSVRTEKTMDIPNRSILQTLQGSVAGLHISTPIRPGESPGFRIRGLNSLSISNNPLVVVDNIIYNGSLNDFNVNDIEKIDILKDASAAAVYGSRSSNGVIIITTKMGKTSKPTFNFNSYTGISNPLSLIPALDGPGFIQKVLDYRESVGLEADPNNIEDYLWATEVNNLRKGQTVNWSDEMIKTGITQNYNINVSGKTDKTSYYLSGTYFGQEGIVENDNFERLTAKANFTNKITDWYSISLRTSFSSLDYSGVAPSIYPIISYTPYGSYWEDEAQGIIQEFPTEEHYFAHPLVALRIDNKDVRTSLLSTVSSELSVPFIEGLKWTLNYSTHLRSRKLRNFWDNTIAAGGGTNLNGRAQKNIYDNFDWTLDNIINYRHTFLNIHSVDVTLLYSREYQQYDQTIAESNNFFSQELGYNSLQLGETQQTISDFSDENSVAYMARLNYIFNGKYGLTATVRKDGFSGFSNDNKYAIFKSAAFSWTASKEEFMNNISWLDLLKLRLSYGENGNQALGRYQTLSRLADSKYVFGDGGSSTSTVYAESMANSELGWETTKIANIGLDFVIFQNKLSGDVNIYSSNTYNIILRRNIPAISGFKQVWTNIGKVHNQGVEITLNSINLKKNDLTWESGLVFTLNRNRIVNLLGIDADGDGKEDDDIANQWFIDEPLNVIYGYKTDGIHQLDDIDIPGGFKPGDFRLVDKNGDGEIEPDDRMILGSTLPNYTFGLSNTLRFKNFSLYMMIYSIQGGGKDNYYVGNNIAMHNVNYPKSTESERNNIQDVPYWTPDNPSNEYSSIHYMASRPHPYLEDRSFVKLQDVSLSYSFDQNTLKKFLLKDLRVYVSGKNLYTWTKWTGYDPESRTTKGDFPSMRTFTLGIDLKF